MSAIEMIKRMMNQIKFILSVVLFFIMWALAPMIVEVQEFFFPPMRFRYISKEFMKNVSDNIKHPVRWECRQWEKINKLQYRIYDRMDSYPFWDSKIYTYSEK